MGAYAFRTLRRISTGVHALRKPTNGRRSYLACELAEALQVSESSISRWIEQATSRPTSPPRSDSGPSLSMKRCGFRAKDRAGA